MGAPSALTALLVVHSLKPISLCTLNSEQTACHVNVQRLTDFDDCTTINAVNAMGLVNSHVPVSVPRKSTCQHNMMVHSLSTLKAEQIPTAEKTYICIRRHL